MINVAVLSYWHVHAKDYTRQAIGNPDTRVAAIWDEIPERGKLKASEAGCPYYESLDELLANKDIDAVIVVTPTNVHRDVMVAAANAGKHIFTEKVLATTIKEANEIVEAARRNKVILTISLPRLNPGYTQAVQKVLEEGALGDLTLVRVRLSHNGATKGWLPDHFYDLQQCGGGALIDLGCHPMYLTRLFQGMPESVSAHYGYVTGNTVEDNAIAILKYESGGFGIVEAGFVNDHSPFSIEIQGTKGSLLYGTPETAMKLRSTLLPASEAGWIEVDLPEARISSYDQWVDHIRNGTEAEENIRLALDLTRLMEASNLSVKLGRPVLIKELKEV